MSSLSNIPIKNVFYMLSYAYRSLKVEDSAAYNTENFKNVTELYTEILIISVSKIVKRGMWKEYSNIQEDSSFIKGKVDVKETLNIKNTMKHKIAVQYEILTENNLFNQILKSILIKLMIHRSLNDDQKKRIRNIIIYFSDVEEISLSLNLWRNIRYINHNIFYQLPIDISRYLYEELLLKEADGSSSNQKVREEQQLSSLFEKFVFNFYRKESGYKVSSPYIYWNVDDSYNEGLPTMKTDIVLENESDILIIDTKFYQENMRKSHENAKLKHIPNNIYQLFSYIENYKKKKDKQISGLLLYAKTNTKEQPNHSYTIKGNNLGIESIDLSQNFKDIKKDLLDLAAQKIKLL